MTVTKKITKPTIVVAALLIGILASVSLSIVAESRHRKHHHQSFRAELDGFQEVASVFSNAHGTLIARATADDIDYELTYSGLQSNVTQIHLHFGQSGANGGVVAFLCQTAEFPDPTGRALTCPQSGTLRGTLTAANVIEVEGQAIGAGEFAKLVAALRAGVIYVNVHTTLAAELERGEIRGQIGRTRVDDDD
jgi:hypothetical protein